MFEDSVLGDAAPEDLTGSTPDVSPRGYAAVTVVAAVLTATGLAGVGYVLGLTQRDVVTAVVTALVAGVLAAGYAVFRAMVTVAEREDGAATAAVRHPAFLSLFAALVVVVSVYFGFLYDQYLA